MTEVVTSRPASDRSFASKALVAVGCLAAAVFALGAHWIQDQRLALLYGFLSTLVLLGATLALRARRNQTFAWQPAFAFFVLALVQLLNAGIQWAGVHAMHDPPTSGDPLASTVRGTVLIQLLETAVAVVPILLLSRAFGLHRASVYATRGKSVGWIVGGIALFVVMVLVACVLPPSRLFHANASTPVATKVALIPALVVLALSNGFQEEFLFRGLFLRKYEAIFGRGGANVLQALVFAIAHQGISYTPFLLVFTIVIILPLGLFAGWLMQRTDSVLAPAIIHGALDVAIYMAFLTSVA